MQTVTQPDLMDHKINPELITEHKNHSIFDPIDDKIISDMRPTEYIQYLEIYNTFQDWLYETMTQANNLDFLKSLQEKLQLYLLKFPKIMTIAELIKLTSALQTPNDNPRKYNTNKAMAKIIIAISKDQLNDIVCIADKINCQCFRCLIR